MTAQRVECPIRGCAVERKRSELFCRVHWFQVPKPLREEIWRLYRNERGGAAHLAALREATRLVNGLQAG